MKRFIPRDKQLSPKDLIIKNHNALQRINLPFVNTNGLILFYTKKKHRSLKKNDVLPAECGLLSFEGLIQLHIHPAWHGYLSITILMAQDDK